MKSYTVTLNEIQVDLIMRLIAYGLNALDDKYTQTEIEQLDSAHSLLDEADAQ